jgi:anti-anti-sigma factor
MRRGRRSEPRQHEALAIEPERDRVRVWCRGALDTFAATRLRDECNGLLERGFTRLVLDLSRATSIGPAGVTTIAATDQRARTLGARLSVVPPTGTAAETLRRSGLLGQLHLEGARDDIFWDWSR